MPKATAAWLIRNTKLSFDQIACFCKLHRLEVQAIADGDSANLIGSDPIALGQLTKEEINRCESDESLPLALKQQPSKAAVRGKKYVPIVNRQDKPDSVLWLLKHDASFTDREISKLVGTAISTVSSIRNKTYWNYDNLKPRDPIALNICSPKDLDKAVKAAEKRKGSSAAKPK